MKLLSEKHSQKRTDLWEMTHNVEKMTERIEDGCTFVERVVKYGSGPEVLSMKKLISTQILSLINNSPNPEIAVKLEFVTDEEKFKKVLDEHFGRLTTDSEPEAEPVPAPAPETGRELKGTVDLGLDINIQEVFKTLIY